ncbi:MAG TPA: hypothetical protein VEJ17_00290 [Candidatus Nitrosotalea sp.]|nr:hypothetical protein [Candidatus Nitrosotalea sp.]
MGVSVNEQELSAVRTMERSFEHEVLEKLSRLEAKMDSLVGNGQPGRMTLAENRIEDLVRNDVRRTVIERFVNAGIAVLISAGIALHGHWWK